MMMPSRISYDRWLFTLRLLLLAATNVPITSGQQVGVSLQLHGVKIPNSSLVDFEDLLYRTPSDPHPTNMNGLQTLTCVTDLVACCDSQGLGNWYFPNGNTIGLNSAYIAAFQRNRGQNDVIGNEQFYGSVRLWRRYTPLERGLFRCELPDTQNVVQTCYVNILRFAVNTISPSGTTTAGEVYSLTCSATLHSSNPPLPNSYITPSLTFEWFYGPDGNAPLPFGLTPTVTDLNNDTYTSTLQFFPLSQFHTGNYTCRLGAGRLVNSTMVTVNAPPISVQITTSGALMLGQNGYSLICRVNGANNLSPSITYEWTKNNDTQSEIQVEGDLQILPFSPLRLSDAGQYTCQATVSSPYLNNDTTVMNSQDIRIQIPTQSSITLTSSIGNSGVQIVGSDVTLTCTVEISSVIQSSEISSLTVDAQLSRDGTPLILTGRTVSGTIFTYTRRFEPFVRNDSGNYTCIATIRPQLSLRSYLTGDETIQSDSVSIKAVSAPPLNFQATQLNSSAPVEVSWSPLSNGDAVVIIYRIFYGNGQNISVQAVSSLNDVTLRVRLRVNAEYVGQIVSLRSETDQLYSELVNVTVTRAMMAMGCSSEIGITVGVVIVVVCLVVMVITIVVILCLWRKKSSHSHNSKFVVSANMAYGQMSLKLPGRTQREYENPDRFGQWTDTSTSAAATYETIDTQGNPMGPDYVYARADEVVRTSSEQ